MGYNLHITRKENWTDDDDASGISLLEWRSYVEGDHEMQMETKASAMTDEGEAIELESAGLAYLKNYSKHGVNGNKAWFLFNNGEIEVKNPDAEIRNKMIDIAAALNAIVQGDDGELYLKKEPV